MSPERVGASPCGCPPRAADGAPCPEGTQGASTQVATDLDSFRRQILSWYDTHRRVLPWRGDPDPYHVLVSEVMLQQTGVERVKAKYGEFLARFPTLRSLAEASTADVLRAWQGLGYNRRALNLKRAAEACCRTYDCRLPGSIRDLEALPGIGRYTARAVACFAFGVQTEVVDTNVRRVLSGLAGRDLTERETEELARQLLPEGRAADWNQALMDYGALVYKAKPKRSPGAPQPFESTNRFWRGRIIDALRAHDALSLPDLLQALPYPNRDENRVRGLVRALHEEGMVEYDVDVDRVSLPG
ncbi:MAG: A/G-specific adenine glycosylase [Chloroflexi bacterium]|nr:A/G-specific adenine glycosylase [Chloroflexota bacterium]